MAWLGGFDVDEYLNIISFEVIVYEWNINYLNNPVYPWLHGKILFFLFIYKTLNRELLYVPYSSAEYSHISN